MDILKRINREQTEKLKLVFNQASQSYSGRLKIIYIEPDAPADLFYQYQNRPSWFNRHFIPEFDLRRKELESVIFLVLEFSHGFGSPDGAVEIESVKKLNGASFNVVGSVVFEEHPDIRHFGREIPIFGWLKADRPEVFDLLINIIKAFASSLGYSEIRGPLSLPKAFGGWGYIAENWDNTVMYNYPLNEEDLAKYYENLIDASGITPEMITEYENTTHFKTKFNAPEIKGVKMIHPLLKDLMKQPELLGKIKDFIEQNFVGHLPDTSIVGLKVQALGKIFQYIDDPSLFYQIALFEDKPEIAGFIFAFPNLFEIWQRLEEDGDHPIGSISSSIWDTIIVEKSLRNAHMGIILYQQLHDRMIDGGIKYMIDPYVWKANTAAYKGLLQVSTHRHTIKVLNVPLK